MIVSKQFPDIHRKEVFGFDAARQSFDALCFVVCFGFLLSGVSNFTQCAE